MEGKVKSSVNKREEPREERLTLFTNTEEEKETTLHLKPTYALGLRSCGRTVVDFAGDCTVIYPVAHHLVMYNLETRAMDFFHHIHHVKCIQSFQVSPNRELLAVAEVLQQGIGHVGALGAAAAMPLTTSPLKGSNVALQSLLRDQEAHALAIYKLGTKTRVRNIPLPANSSVVSCSFSTDNKFLAVLEDAPTHSVTYWKVSNCKLLASGKCPSRGSRIHISPTNANFISVSGPATLKYWVWTNNDFKISNFLPQLKDQEHFVDHTWLKEHMVALSERDLLLCFRIALDGCNADLVHSFRCHQPSHVRMECVTAHGKGFVLGGSAGFFSIFEASDDPKDPFPFVRSVSVGDIAFDCIAVSPNSETIVACSKSRELVTFSMSAIDTGQEDKIEFRELIRHSHQIGPVLQVDVSVQRPIVVTCGTDKTVRVWNFELNHYELLSQCPEEPTTVAVHPSGFQLVVAFKERVRVYQLLQESLRQVKELATKACRFVRYAHGGHLFACASGLTVKTFRTYTFEAVHTFSGHIGAVRCLSWSRDDVYLFSAAHDGSIYRWDISTGLRSEEMQHVVKHCQYAAFVVDRNDPSVVVASGSDGKIREITGGEETKSYDLPAGTVITSMALMKDCRRLFVGTKAGSILTYPWPLRNKGVAEYFAHAEGILHLRVTEDNEQLITCAEDGSVGIFKILNGGLQHQEKDDSCGTRTSRTGVSTARPVSSSASAERRKAGETYTDAVLVARDDLEERRAEVLEWRLLHDQVKADVEFALHRKENEWINRLHVLKEESEHLVVQERVRYEELEARHQLATRKHTEELTQLEAHHVKMTQELENQYERKLAQEMARYDALSETLEQTRQRCEALMEAQDSQNRGTLHAERKAAYTRSKEQNEIIKRLHEDLKYNHVKFEEVLHQEETDYEYEMQKMRAEFTTQLENERQNTAVKQGQVSAANTRLESLRRKMQELEAASHARDVLLSTERAKLARLEATLANYERHFEVCRGSSHEKEKTITGLKSDNRVLENFRSVLSHRIDGLETEQVPMHEHLHALESKISEMQAELADEYLAKAEAQQETETKDAKIRTLLHEVKTLRQNSLKKEYSVGEMTREFTRLTQLTNYKDLESAVKDAYKVYVMGETLHKKPPRAIFSTTSTAASTALPFSPGGGGFYSPAKTTTTFNTKASHVQSKQLQSSTATPANVMASVVSDEALGYDCKQSVDESVKQMEFMSKTIQTLRTALDHAKTQTDRVRRDSVAEGSMLIEECNSLRKENKQLQVLIRDLKRALFITNRKSNNFDGERMSGSLSLSSPQLRPASPSQTPHLDLALDVTAGSGLMSLAPLPTGLTTTPSKQQRRQRTPSSSPSPSPNNLTQLPFGRVERGRHSVARADELASVVEKQKRDIQRLQTQVQLLLSGAADAPLVHHYKGTARVIPLSPSPSSQTLTPLDSSKGAMVVSRIGSLRPLTPAQVPVPLQSSFLLAPPEFHTSAPMKPTEVGQNQQETHGI
ncbi:WD domain-containing protein, putative [Phytophthora infestans T30-4]|uniref:WD domain-containing protein, putative n=1 Tax=Phytophthora infestans (strain T30-4) TaxID=403677 RepID=D0N3D0_PHYIT|nr:WD domain-containing protein, putative [Phytophthora infestans T30-4]EEY69422.1 WD domain-containing protein, putative [Phytophthora infestans T30-4]|eukprot:XP_002999276.1 WD domain-containing protein, putative [Phytophthora infestans T30-4]